MSFLRPLLSPILLVALSATVIALSTGLGEANEPAKPNFLLITVDDMSCDSLGSFGSALEGTSPMIDELAAESLCFDLAHVQVGNCYPSRNVMWSGRYPHNNRAEGFYQVRPIDYPTLCDILQDAGYWVGIRGKVSHSTPYQPYHWDADLTELPDGKKEHMKDAESYFRSTTKGIAEARKAGKPFCINVNISDPHKPFWFPGDPHGVTREFTAEEVPVPGFLHDDPMIREELALYYTSVRRADDCVGEILRALDESDAANDTVVFFLSDHGMPLPFAKTQLYHHSTRTPLIVRWPGVTEAGTRDGTHLVSAVDFVPTLCDIAGIEPPAGLDGESFEPLLRGEPLENRDAVFKVYNENSGAQRRPIRAVQTHDYLYLFNPWSDGTNTFNTATHGTKTWRRMKELAESDPAIAARVDLLLRRVPEELYDIRNDPDCLVNLIDSTEHEEALEAHRDRLRQLMEESEDPTLEVFLRRDDSEFVSAYIAKVAQEATERRQKTRKAKKNKNNNKKKEPKP